VRCFESTSFPKEEVEIFWKVWAAVMSVYSSVHNLDLGKDQDGKKVELSCHIMARAVESVFFPDLKCVDGSFAGTYYHSWLITASDHVIDVYTGGTLGGPRMIDTRRPSPWSHLYKEMDVREAQRHYEGLFEKPWFIRAVGLTRKALRKAIKSASCEDIEMDVIAEIHRQENEIGECFMGMSS
jgi:hypothetical protein